jgi:UDPglucose 6-dehydrogenase
VKKELWVLRGKTLAVWGLAFKPDTDDVRFAPALNIAKRLMAEGAHIRAYDPQAMQKAKDELPEVTYCLSPYEAAQNADAILILTEWAEFRHPDWVNLAKAVAHRLVIDGRNLYSAHELALHGFQYVCVGKPHVPQLPAAADAKELVVSLVPVASPLSAPAVSASMQPQP